MPITNKISYMDILPRKDGMECAEGLCIEACLIISDCVQTYLSFFAIDGHSPLIVACTSHEILHPNSTMGATRNAMHIK